jgi:hypothetical protein
MSYMPRAPANRFRSLSSQSWIEVDQVWKRLEPIRKSEVRGFTFIWKGPRKGSSSVWRIPTAMQTRNFAPRAQITTGAGKTTVMAMIITWQTDCSER